MTLLAAAGFVPDMLASGEENVHRIFLNTATNAPASGGLRLSYITARKTEDIANVRVFTGGTQAAATPTLCRIGVYSEDASGNLTLIASTANDTTLFAASQTGYTKALQASFTKRQGSRYAVGTLVVSATTMPSFIGLTPQANAELSTVPRLASQVTGQADLPASIAVGSLTGSGMYNYWNLLP